MPFVTADPDSILTAGRLPVPRRRMKQVVPAGPRTRRASCIAISPANVMLEDEQVLVMDFGIARSVSGAEATVAGSRRDVDPWRRAGAVEPVDQRADVYALGSSSTT
jgi:hypothetical protein